MTGANVWEQRPETLSASDLNRHAQRPGLHGLPPAAFSPTAPPIRRPTSERFDGRWPVFTATFSQPKRTIRGARQALTYENDGGRWLELDDEWAVCAAAAHS